MMKFRTVLVVRLMIFAAAVVAASACAPTTPKPVGEVVSAPPPSKSDAWKSVAKAVDEQRIATLGTAWSEALGEARKTNARGVRDEGILLDPDAALARPAPTPGSYYCRLVKLGRTKARGSAFEKFKPFFCYVEVEDDLLTIVKQTGDTRPAGRLWEDDNPNRLVFLGSLALGNTEQPRAYGEDPKRDMAGVLERIAPFRWRLVIPWPEGSAKLDVYELKPVEKQPE
jgi:hypothetical protein